MSGSTGAGRIGSREDYKQIISSYEKIIKKFPGFVSIEPSGSYNSNQSKNEFGDLDLIVTIVSTDDKATIKQKLGKFFSSFPDSVIVPFTSEKYKGKKFNNTGELVTVRYHDPKINASFQIDNIIALDKSEADFKKQFLDMPAEKQGLVLGLVKVATIETDPKILFKKLGINVSPKLDKDQEWEFNLSSVEIQLRKVTYEPGTFKQKDREVVWRSRNFDDLQKILYQFNLDSSFDDLLKQSKTKLKNPRSNNRMQGVFSSMITVKSGEVGTQKGKGKEDALSKIKDTFKEGMSFKRYYNFLK